MQQADRSLVASLQAQIRRTQAAAQPVVDNASLAVSVSNISLPLAQQVCFSEGYFGHLVMFHDVQTDNSR